jgi:3-hydroxyethyl bacteriochlorophyllide a dehydrogenase
LQGYYPDPITFEFFPTHLKRPTVAITCGFDLDEVARCLDLMARGKLRYRELVTHPVPFGDAPGLYPRLAAADPDVLGVVFDWTSA